MPRIRRKPDKCLVYSPSRDHSRVHTYLASMYTFRGYIPRSIRLLLYAASRLVCVPSPFFSRALARFLPLSYPLATPRPDSSLRYPKRARALPNLKYFRYFLLRAYKTVRPCVDFYATPVTQITNASECNGSTSKHACDIRFRSNDRREFASERNFQVCNIISY